MKQHNVDSLDQEIQHAALERLGLLQGQKDYNLDRIVRLAAMSMDCHLAAFSVSEKGQQVYIAAHGADLDDQPDALSAICHTVFSTKEPLMVKDLASDAQWQSHAAVTGSLRLRGYAGMPVYAATKAVIGTLCVASHRPIHADPTATQAMLNDFVRLIEDSLMMRRAAVRDGLTGLFNRRFFQDQIATEWRRAMRLQLPISIVLLDIDHFKTINDSAGHPAGDRVICRIAQIIEKRVRRAGDTVCRFGGEEFAMILPSTDQASGSLLGESIRREIEAAAISHPGHPEGEPRTVTVSVGVATVCTKADLINYSADDIVAKADDALYVAKNAGRNCLRVADIYAEDNAKPATE